MTAWETVCEPCWCGHKPSNRKLLGVHSLEDCKQKCIDSSDCKAIEFWAGVSFCYKCIDETNTIPFNKVNDRGYPPSVHHKGKS